MEFGNHVRAVKGVLTKKIKGEAAVGSMPKLAFFEGFDKEAGAAAELAGLGMLAVPSVQHFRGKEMSENAKAGLEIGGLGILAAPYAKDVAKRGAGAALKMFRRGA